MIVGSFPDVPLNYTSGESTPAGLHAAHKGDPSSFTSWKLWIIPPVPAANHCENPAISSRLCSLPSILGSITCLLLEDSDFLVFTSAPGTE